MKPIDLFPSFTVSNNKIILEKMDFQLPIDFDGSTLAYAFIQHFYEHQSLPMTKDFPQGIGIDQIRQSYRVVLALQLQNISVSAEQLLPPSSKGQQLTNELALNNQLQLTN